ncbi:MAG: CDP-alcohol phosphatidyltransferase family protein [Bacteroidia bacterium]|nr:CDP-alcohol phosphatidyltransferase family protein [Bacteroidia bacterium]NNF30814.1 CDP-alcohol phosphatidyltransferase family protein [Flavobacteriaceae bacterium]MBT8277141.1 CDP-alcohol phosphatidyltransferase family protein [Bacteroidia bacterium]NNJ82008.1 CDP-alcohol phosphatidyltransferase family protein [Flavobacteriaceae bacterium]NNK55622.1 CDP-alcohol phosphatidyltransferase family protein [Flavobacteriaceae bacterium]
MLTFKNYNIADWFSFYRIAAAPVLLLLAIFDLREIFSWMLLISFSTDAIDGYLARTLKISSPRGSQLDSMGDQLTLVMGVVGLFVFEPEFMNNKLQLLLIVFIPYFSQMIIAFVKYGKATAFHTYFAKLSAVVQGVFILWALFFEPVLWLFYTVLTVGVLETIEEITLISMHDNWTKDVKGIYWALKKRRKDKKKDKNRESE